MSASQQEQEQEQERRHQRRLADDHRARRIDIRVQQHPLYHAWVASGGLAKFAAEHNLQPNFVDTLGDQGGMFILKFYARLRAIPGLQDEIVYKGGPDGNGPSSDAFVQAAMAMAEGWDVDKDDDNDNNDDDNDADDSDNNDDDNDDNDDNDDIDDRKSVEKRSEEHNKAEIEAG